MNQPVLSDGACTYSTSFEHVVKVPGGVYSHTFHPEPGHEFITMLLGEAKTGQRVDVDQMLARLGFAGKNAGAKQILELKAEIAELKQRLAEALAGKAE